MPSLSLIKETGNDASRPAADDLLGKQSSCVAMSIFDWFRRAKEENPEFTPAKRLTDDLWVRLVDLPGYRDWAGDYDRLDRIIPDIESYHRLVCPEHVEQPPPGYFERVFQGALDDTYEHFAHLNLPSYNLNDYKRGGKLTNLNG